MVLPNYHIVLIVVNCDFSFSFVFWVRNIRVFAPRHHLSSGPSSTYYNPKCTAVALYSIIKIRSCQKRKYLLREHCSFRIDVVDGRERRVVAPLYPGSLQRAFDSSVGRAVDCRWLDAVIHRSLVQIRLEGLFFFIYLFFFTLGRSP